MEKITETDLIFLKLREIVDEVVASFSDDDFYRMHNHIRIMLSVIKYWPVQLFICVEEFKIYAYKRLPLLVKALFSSQNAEETKKILEEFKKILIEEYSKTKQINKTTISDIKEDLLQSINKEKIVKNCGEELNTALICDEIGTKVKEELQKDDDKNNNILIYCQDEYIDYVWEWIYWKEKNFFWGDRFHIVRIPKNYKFEKDLKFQIDTFTFLLDSYCPQVCKKCKKSKKFLNELLENIVECKKIPLESSKQFRHLKDCVHIGACRETIEKNPDYFKTFKGELALNKPKFLFLNIFTKKNSPSKRGLLSEAINSAPPTIWIDSSLNIEENFASAFVESFYEVFEKSLKNNKEAKIVEIIAKTREKIEKDQKNSFWRLAYIVNGNPSTTLITCV